MNWLITGGCGFIGTNLIKKLIEEKKHNIRIIDNLTVGQRSDLNAVCDFKEISVEDCSEPIAGVQLVVGDIMDETLALKVTKGADVIVHLAANTGVGPSVENPRQDCLTNVIGILNYLEAARINKIGRFVFASSGAPVGEVVPPIHEEMAPHPVSPYGASKLAGEGYCSSYAQTFGVGTVALRFGNVYGPGSNHKNSVVGKFIRKVLKGETLEIYGDGSQTRDFIYISDLVNAVLLAANVSGVSGEIFQIATNSETTLNQLTDIMSKAFQRLGKEMPAVNHIDSRLGDVKRNFSDISKAEKMLGWKQTTQLPEGMKSTIEWFLSRD
jgi:UDP-glucose 4-epimerase